VKWEGAILTQELYDAEAQNTMFIPVVFASQDTPHIPVILRGQTYYDVSADKGYKALYRHLTGQLAIAKPKLGKLKSMPLLKPHLGEASPGSVAHPIKKDTAMTKFQLLHISDLHVKSGEEFDRSVVLEPLIDRVEHDMVNGIQPEIVVATGDVAFSGKEAEYQKAKDFFDGLLARMHLSQGQAVYSASQSRCG